MVRYFIIGLVALVVTLVLASGHTQQKEIDRLTAAFEVLSVEMTDHSLDIETLLNFVNAEENRTVYQKEAFRRLFKRTQN